MNVCGTSQKWSIYILKGEVLARFQLFRAFVSFAASLISILVSSAVFRRYIGISPLKSPLIKLPNHFAVAISFWSLRGGRPKMPHPPCHVENLRHAATGGNGRQGNLSCWNAGRQQWSFGKENQIAHSSEVHCYQAVPRDTFLPEQYIEVSNIPPSAQGF